MHDTSFHPALSLFLRPPTSEGVEHPGFRLTNQFEILVNVRLWQASNYASLLILAIFVSVVVLCDAFKVVALFRKFLLCVSPRSLFSLGRHLWHTTSLALSFASPGLVGCFVKKPCPKRSSWERKLTDVFASWGGPLSGCHYDNIYT